MGMMQRICSTLLLLLAISSISFGQSLPGSDHKITPTADSRFSHNVYIPKNFEECFSEMNKMLTKAFIKEIKSTPTEKLLLKRFNTEGLGIWMQRNWGLQDPGGSRLSRYLTGLGINHPSHMSAVILESYWRHLNGDPIRVVDQMPLLQESE